MQLRSSTVIGLIFQVRGCSCYRDQIQITFRVLPYLSILSPLAQLLTQHAVARAEAHLMGPGAARGRSCSDGRGACNCGGSGLGQRQGQLPLGGLRHEPGRACGFLRKDLTSHLPDGPYAPLAS